MPTPIRKLRDIKGPRLYTVTSLTFDPDAKVLFYTADNAAFREYTYATFQAHVLDMETAAVAAVAYSNGVPYIAFRSLSEARSHMAALADSIEQGAEVRR